MTLSPRFIALALPAGALLLGSFALIERAGGHGPRHCTEQIAGSEKPGFLTIAPRRAPACIRIRLPG